MKPIPAYSSTRIWTSTVQKLRILHALTGESIVALLDRLVGQELQLRDPDQRLQSSLHHINLIDLEQHK